MTATTITLWLKHRMKQAGVLTCPAEKQQTLPGSWVLTNPAAPSTLKMMLSFILVFTPLFFVSLLVSSLWRGQWWGIFQLCCCCLFFAIVCSLGWSLNVSHPVSAGTASVGEGHCPVCAAWGRGAASSKCARMIDTSQTLPLDGVFLIGALDPCKSNWGHWIDDFSK